jgi:hypothetical protein
MTLEHQEPFSKSSKVLIAILSSFLLVFLFYKINVSSFTHDESFTFNEGYHLSSTKHIFSYKKSFSNNHLLNSYFIKLMTNIPGPNSELKIRFPNFLLFILYLFFAFKLSKRNVFTFVLLTTNILLFDLFGLARGYGLGLGFMMAAVYFIINSFKKRQYQNIIFFHSAMLLASLSHFTFLFVYSCIMATYFTMILVQTIFKVNRLKDEIRLLLFNLINILIVLACVRVPVKRMLNNNSFKFVEDSGFYGATLKHYGKIIFQNSELNPTGLLVFQIGFSLFVLISVFVICQNLYSLKGAFLNKERQSIFFIGLGFFIPIGLLAQNLILDIRYPVERFLIFMVPIYILAFVHFINLIFRNQQQLKNGFIIMLSCISLISFVLLQNPKVCGEWEYDRETKFMLLDIKEQMNNKYVDKKFQIGVDWIFEPTVNFYREQMPLEWLQPCNRDGFLKTDDLYYLFENELDKLPIREFQIIKKYESINTVIVWNKEKNGKF